MGLGADHREDLVDRIYEAAVVPELWPDVLADLTKVGDGAYANLFVLKDGNLRSVGTPEADTVIADYIALARPELNTRITRVLRQPPRTGFWTDFEIFSEDEISREPFYRDFLHPRGYGWVAATLATVPTGELLSVSVERHHHRGHYERPAVDRLDLLSSHLSRAGMLAARLGLERAHAMADAMNAIGLPAAVLRFNGRPLAMNALFEKLLPDVVHDRRERLALLAAGADTLFADALASLRRGARNEAVWSIPLAAGEQRPPMIVHIVPILGAAQDIFAQAASIVVVTPVEPAQVPQAEVLQGLFDLTPAESRVARGIGEGRTVEDLAGALALSRETVRSQLKVVLAKAGLSRQAELVSLLARHLPQH